MKNSDMPIAPIVGSNGRVQPFTDDQGFSSMATGLTKREHFAGLAMQGMLSSKYTGAFMPEINNDYYDKLNGLARNATRYADALLKQLGE